MTNGTLVGAWVVVGLLAGCGGDDALADECQYCDDPESIGMCEQTVAGGVAVDCINLSTMFSDLDTGC